MSLPIRTTVDDIDAVCGYLATKPTGATLAEAKAVVDKKRLDSRKLTALKFWELIDDAGGKLKITERGRRCVKESGALRSMALREVVRDVQPYLAIVERLVHRRENTITTTEVASHWHEHFTNYVSDSDKILNDQAVCFFQIAQGADLGALTIGRRGSSTRFDLEMDAARTALEGLSGNISEKDIVEKHSENGDESEADIQEVDDEHYQEGNRESIGNRVFITHGKNRKILNQVKELVVYGKFEPVVSMENETAAKPVPKKVMDDMRTCNAAVIHVSAEGIKHDDKGNEIPQINENVLIEIGAAMALYGDKFVLLVEEGLRLPSNLQGLYECRYQGDELNMSAIMKLLRAFSEF